MTKNNMVVQTTTEDIIDPIVRTISYDITDPKPGQKISGFLKEKGIPFVFRCINRLDRDTSGLTIVAKHMVSAAILSRMVAAKSKAGGIHREYLAIVQGIVEPSEGVIDAPIARKESACLERVIDFEKGDRAVTHYRKIAEKNGNSLVLLKLETGRTHQIRVHMKYLGYPLIGDFLYHPDYADNQIDRRQETAEGLGRDAMVESAGRNHLSENVRQRRMSEHDHQYEIHRQALHACRLRFPHPMTGEWMEFTAPLPEDMCRML